MNSPFEVAIIGGGVSGATLATRLSQSPTLGGKLVLLEKGRRLGGRSTVYSSPIGELPLGAPQALNHTELCDLWLEVMSNSESAHSACLTLLSHHVSQLSFDGSQAHWSLSGEHWTREGERLPFECKARLLVLSCPPPQSLGLLQTMSLEEMLPEQKESISRIITKISSIKMVPTWCALVSGDLSPAINSGLSLNDSAVISKIIEVKAHSSYVIHTESKWSQAHLEWSVSEVYSKIEQTLMDLNCQGFEILKCHRWRFAGGDTDCSQSPLYNHSLRLGLCGDMYVLGSQANGIERAQESAHLLGIELSTSILEI